MPDDFIRGHREIKQDTVDETTKSLYNSQKAIYNFIRHRISDLSPDIQKYFRHVSEFIEGYESGVIRHWWQYYNTSKDIMDSAK